MDPAARAVAASTLYSASPPKRVGPPAPRDTTLRDKAESSDEEGWGADDGWVPVSADVVDTWKSVALSGTAVAGSCSLDLAGAQANVAPLLQRMNSIRVVASCGNLQSMLPDEPAPRPPGLTIPVAPSVRSSDCSSLRCAGPA